MCSDVIIQNGRQAFFLEHEKSSQAWQRIAAATKTSVTFVFLYQLLISKRLAQKALSQKLGCGHALQRLLIAFEVVCNVEIDFERKILEGTDRSVEIVKHIVSMYLTSPSLHRFIRVAFRYAVTSKLKRHCCFITDEKMSHDQLRRMRKDVEQRFMIHQHPILISTHVLFSVVCADRLADLEEPNNATVDSRGNWNGLQRWKRGGHFAQVAPFFGTLLWSMLDAF